jgi:hypothetical protein
MAQLTEEEKALRRRRAIPASVARTMAFEGKAVSPETIRKICLQIGIPDSSTPRSAS